MKQFNIEETFKSKDTSTREKQLEEILINIIKKSNSEIPTLLYN